MPITSKYLFFRFPRIELEAIIVRYREAVERDTYRSHAISALHCTLIALKYFATGCDWRNISEKFGVSKSTVSRCVLQFCDVLVQDAENWIFFPCDTDTLQNHINLFYQFAGFPNCVGAIDGTLIRIQKPAIDDHVFVCRKGFHAMNVLLICNAEQRIMYCNAKFPGSSHDSYIFRSSNIAMALQTNAIPCGVLIGDSGFKLDSRLMTPYLSPANEQQLAYNRAHRRTRCVIERCNGLLKSRFRCLDVSGGPLRMKPQKCSKVILACCCLHNRALQNRIPMPDGDQPPPQSFSNETTTTEYTESGRQRRAIITDFLTR